MGIRLSIVCIGNSRGIRIPKKILESCHLEGEIEAEARGGALVLRPLRHPRQGWDQAFARMAREEDDRLPEDESWPATQWDRQEWTW